MSPIRSRGTTWLRPTEEKNPIPEKKHPNISKSKQILVKFLFEKVFQPARRPQPAFSSIFSPLPPKWSRLWWWPPDGVIEVRSGDQSSRVSAQRVSEWDSKQFRKGKAV